MIKMSSMSEGDHDADDEDLFEDSFNFESQVLREVNNIEEVHSNNKNIKELSKNEDHIASMCKTTPNNRSLSKSKNVKKNGVHGSVKSMDISLKSMNNLNIVKDSPKFASTPTVINQSSRNLKNKSKKSFEEAFESPIQIKRKDVSIKQDNIVKQNDTESSQQLQLSNWGLPDCVVDSYYERGIRTMFKWQVECLTADNGVVLSGGNLVYSAPTSAGKTLVAELLMMKRVFETQKKALLILPFVSLAREKMFHLQSVLRDAGIRVEGFMGSQSPSGGLKTTDIAVATIEKANSLVNRLLEEGLISNLSCVVVDELHMLGDQSRGYLLELLLTKILYVAGDNVQIIGMSATLPNLSDLSSWLKASLYTTTFRPVPLTELIKIDNTLLDTKLRPVGVVTPKVSLANDTDHITWLCLQTIMESHSVLLFCPIKSWVESLAETLANDFFQIGRPDPSDTDPESISARTQLQSQLCGDNLSEILEQLSRCPAGLDRTLARVIRMGVAYHHAGLTTDERDIVEAGFKNGVIRVLVATSTLSSGVNLPARRVILRCPLTYNGQLMDKLQYKQMVGRAGRKGVDTEGESILICKQAERDKVSQLVSGESERVVSCLVGQNSKLASSMKRAILEVIVSGAATSVIDVERYANCTLLAAQLNTVSITECVQFLLDAQFIKLQDSNYVATRLGLACLASSLAPDEGLAVYAELSKARRQFVLENELHIIYLIVPIYAAVSWPKLDWMGFLTMWENLADDMKRVGSIIGVEERWMVRAMRGTVRMADAEQRKSLAIHQRFYTALALHDLVNEMPLSNVAAKYGATKGMLQNLQQAASTFSGMVTVFCDRLGWNNLELLIGQFQSRLEFGVQRELVDLCRLLSVDGARARILFDAGVTNVAILASSKSGDIEQILHKNTAFSAKVENEEDTDLKKKIKNIFIAGLAPMTESECAILMVQEARAIMKRDLGLTESAWSGVSNLSKVSIVAENNNTPIKTKGNAYKSPNPEVVQNVETISSTVDNKKQKCETPVAKPIVVSPKSIKEKASEITDNTVKCDKKDSSILSTKKKSLESSSDKTTDLFDLSGMSDTFDMSSVVENIFNDEAEIKDSKVNENGTKKKKKVSWGDDDKEGYLCVEKEITPCNSQTIPEVLATPVVNRTIDYQPKTPKFQVCSEDLDLHWSGSDSDSDCVIEERGEKVNEVMANDEDVINDSNDVFGDTISDSVLVRAMDQNHQGNRQMEMSSGMMMAAEGLDSKINFTDQEIGVSDTSVSMVKNTRRKRKRRKQLTSASVNFSSQILSDSETDPEATEINSGNIYEEAVDDRIENIDKLTVVDVCSNRRLFESFSNELKSKKSFSIACAVSRVPENDSGYSYKKLLLHNGILVGMAITWFPSTSFYINLSSKKNENIQDSFNAPDDDPTITMEEKLQLITSIVSIDKVQICGIDLKRQANILYHVTGRVIKGLWSDPIVAAWLLDPAAGQLTLSKLVLDHSPFLSPVLTTLGSSPGYGSVSCHPGASEPARHRAVAESILVHTLDIKIKQKLETNNLLNHYLQVEMRCQEVLLKMELSGMGLNEKEYEDTKLLLDARLRIIEESAYRMAGRHFSLSSPPDICKVLYHELRMPVNGDPKLNLKNVRKGGLRLSASKEILEKLISSDYKLPGLILEHRRISSALSKTVAPLLHVAVHHPVINQPRVYPSSVTNTLTGRVSMQEPNLQNIPKNFQVELTQDLKMKALGRRASSRKRVNSSSLALTPLARLLSPGEPSTTVSLRLAITPIDGNLLISADYSQLELRILAHMSGDKTLIDALSSGEDVFKSMAAQINSCDLDKVSDTMRQQAKQIVYGVIYGIGDKSLADQLGVEINEAVRFMESFKCKYTNVRAFLHECVMKARVSGNVTTLSGRQRHLADINHNNMARRAAAERQAVNTRVQGSAADLVKTAMVNIDTKLRETWPSCRPLKWSQARVGTWPADETRGAWLVLQLHDELIYEVSGEDVLQVAEIVKSGMETAMKLLVPTPVRVKVGATWGELQDFQVDRKT